MKKHPDYILAGTTMVLLVLGILVLSSVSAAFSLEKYGNTFYFLKRQITFGIIPGLILALFIFRIKLVFLKKWSLLLLLINLLLMGMVFLPGIGITIGGATRWVNLRLFSFQPAEFLKLTFFLYLAAWLGSKTQSVGLRQKRKPFQRGEAPSHLVGLIVFFVILALISLLLIFQPNISTLAVIVLVGAIMYFSANTPLWHGVLIISVALGGILTLIKIAPYRFERILVFLEPGIDPMGIGYQIKQALIAIGSGGISGLGLGMSLQKFGFLPQPMSDTIFAILAEETGFIGSLTLIFLFLIFLWRGFKIAKAAPDKFSQLTALGISSWICLQGFINIGSMIGILPLTGIPLPFISYGGSALISGLIGVGILLNISKSCSQ